VYSPGVPHPHALAQTRAGMDSERANCISSCQEMSKGGSIIVLKLVAIR
jgi:hypothetical protein